MRRKTPTFYDYEELRSISIVDVASAYGANPEKKGNDYWCRIRDSDKTPSCKLYTKTNTFYDFGIGEGGDTIKLSAYFNNCSYQDGAIYLAEMFGIQSIKGQEKITFPSDRQFLMIGIYPDIATKNFDFDLDNFSLEVAEKISEKYHMSMRSLYEQYPNVYHNVLKTKAVPYVAEMQKYYYTSIVDEIAFTSIFGGDPNYSKEIIENHERFEKLRKLNSNLIMAEKALDLAVQDKNQIYFHRRSYNLVKDYNDFLFGKKTIEYDGENYKMLKKVLAANGKSIAYINGIPYEKYVTVSEKLSNITPFSAFYKGGKMNIAFDKAFQEQFQNICFETANNENFENPIVEEPVDASQTMGFSMIML